MNNSELPVLQANNPQALIKYIKWASTVAKQVSSPNSIAANITSKQTPIDTGAIPVAQEEDSDVW